MHHRRAASISLGLLLLAAGLVGVFDHSIVVQAKGPRFIVGPDETLTYPSNLTDLADEHTTIFPPTPAFPKYLFLASSGVVGATGGAVALETSNLKTFDFATGYATQVMTPAIRFGTCKAFYDPEFDLNYAAPGSVVRDPTQPPGHLIMIYEAENHCPGAVWQHDFYATVGFARSSDNGVTWPDPIDGEFGGTDRYPVLKNPTPEPMMAENPQVAIGNAIPSAIVTRNERNDSFIYVVYSAPGPDNDAMLRIARAKLGGDGQVEFSKWFDGAFAQPGIGGRDSAALPSRGCTGRQSMGQISYNDVVRRFLLVFVCVDAQNGQAYQAGWFFSTATSLELEDWTSPQLIEHSQFPIISGSASDGTGQAFDGWYPSLMSPGYPSGQIGLAGKVFFMSGCDRGKRQFLSRRFVMAPPLE